MRAVQAVLFNPNLIEKGSNDGRAIRAVLGEVGFDEKEHGCVRPQYPCSQSSLFEARPQAQGLEPRVLVLPAETNAEPHLPLAAVPGAGDSAKPFRFWTVPSGLSRRFGDVRAGITEPRAIRHVERLEAQLQVRVAANWICRNTPKSQYLTPGPRKLLNAAVPNRASVTGRKASGSKYAVAAADAAEDLDVVLHLVGALLVLRRVQRSARASR